MANVLSELFQDIADAIRTKTGGTETMAPASFPENILAIEAGSSGGGSVDGACYVTFMSEDGTTELYKRAVVAGNHCGDVVTLGLLDTPVKESSAQYDYPFSGWSLTAGGEADSAALQNVTEDRTVYAAFGESTRYYTVRFYDGETLLNSMEVEYGATADYTAEKALYRFEGWEPSNENIVADTDCYAKWVSEEIPTLEEASWAFIDEASQNGLASTYWKIGDTKTVGSNTVQIAGFNLDKLASSTYETAGITFLSTTFYGTSKMGENYDSSIDRWGFSGCTLRTYCKETILPSLPEDLQAVIKPVTKKTTHGVYSSTSFTTTTDSVWVPSCGECNVQSYKDYNTSRYTVLDTAEERALLGAEWWLRTSNSYSKAYTVKASGSYDYPGNYYAKNVLFGFCV